MRDRLAGGSREAESVHSSLDGPATFRLVEAVTPVTALRRRVAILQGEGRRGHPMPTAPEARSLRKPCWAARPITAGSGTFIIEQILCDNGRPVGVSRLAIVLLPRKSLEGARQSRDLKRRHSVDWSPPETHNATSILVASPFWNSKIELPRNMIRTRSQSPIVSSISDEVNSKAIPPAASSAQS